MKKKLLVIADKNAAVKSFPRHVLIARQFLGADCWGMQPSCFFRHVFKIVAGSVRLPCDWE